ncbi:MAG: DUF1203 domain-containing protein [Bacteroidota bacterium]
MLNHFQIVGIDPAQFNHLFDWSEAALHKINAIRQKVDQQPGFPCRVSLQDATIGEEVILLPFTHHAVDAPYRATGPIYIRKNAQMANLAIDEIPQLLRHRLLALRAYDEGGMMQMAQTVDGQKLEPVIQSMLAQSNIQYIQVHNAGPGCYNCQINRVP